MLFCYALALATFLIGFFAGSMLAQWNSAQEADNEEDDVPDRDYLNETRRS